MHSRGYRQVPGNRRVLISAPRQSVSHEISMITIVFSGGGPLPHTTGIVWPVFRQIGHISWNRVLSSRILTAKVSAYGARPLPCPHPPGRFPPRSTARGERENGVFSCVQPLALPHEFSRVRPATNLTHQNLQKDGSRHYSAGYSSSVHQTSSTVSSGSTWSAYVWGVVPASIHMVSTGWSEMR